MKISLPRQHARALTIFEVLIVVAILVILASMILPRLARSHARVSRISCVNNLKQVGLSFRQWTYDYNGAYPMTVSTAQDGAADYVGMPEATWRIFGCMSNTLNTPKILLCPNESDSQRLEATTFGNFIAGQTGYKNNANLSYFVGVDAAQTCPGMILGGDHNIGDGPLPPADAPARLAFSDAAVTSLQAVGTNISDIRVAWTKGNHKQLGNLVFADGSAHQVGIPELRQALAESGDPGRTNVIGKWLGSSPWQNRLQFPSLP